MKFDEYLSMPGINWSALKHMRESPARYAHMLRQHGEDSTTLAIGRAVHTLTLQPDMFNAEFAIWTGGRRAGKEWDAFEADHATRTILKADEYELSRAMALAVLHDSTAAKYLRLSDFERSMQWVDHATGLPCKARTDITRASDRVLADLKTCASIDARRFGQAAARLGYAPQLAHYAAGIRASHGWTPRKVALIAVEKTPPHEVAVFILQPEQLDAAAEEVAALLLRLSECMDTASWPGRYSEEVPLQLPTYVDGELEIAYE